MEQYLSITEMARRRGITTETLRYYDRIGLLKPDFLDKNRVRFYSVLKYEELETIRELQQLGLELKEIARYLSDRRVDTSYELLLRQQAFCRDKIRYYQTLEEKIEGKLTLLAEQRSAEPALLCPEIIRIRERRCIAASESVTDEVSLAYACMELESRVKQWDPLAPIYASDRYAGKFSLKDADLQQTQLLFLLPEENEKMPEAQLVLQAGRYLRLYSGGPFWRRDTVRTQILAYAEKYGLCLSGDAIVISKIDYSITDIPAERLYEFQVRVL